MPHTIMLVAGKADAFASDDILLAGFIATRHDGRGFGIVGDYLSFEPYAITLRRNDPAFADLVKQSFARMASEGTLDRLYTRWLVDRLAHRRDARRPYEPVPGGDVSGAWSTGLSSRPISR